MRIFGRKLNSSSAYLMTAKTYSFEKAEQTCNLPNRFWMAVTASDQQS